jgi:serine/threonine protein kinase
MAVIGGDDRTYFGPYRIIRRIGTGGMGSVFEAEDTGLGHRVALKLLHPHVAERPGAARRFLREGRAAARIRHPHVVQVFALGTDGDTPYLAMELLDGGNLSELLTWKGALPIADTLDLVLPVLTAVAAAHDAGVIHRDLKPSNVCISQGPCARPWPKVVDFGVSKVVAAGGVNEATLTETVIGTAAYMAPEQARAACNASFHSDQYSLAVMLYQCITGHLPFGGRSMYEVLESVMSAPVAPPSARAKDVPRALDEAVLRGMSRNPTDRFPSVRAFGHALLQFASEHARASCVPELVLSVPSDSGAAVARDVAGGPVAADPATPVGDTTTPPTESHHTRKEPRVTSRAGWLALTALLCGAIVATSLARQPRKQGMPVSRETSAPAAVIVAAADSAPAVTAPAVTVENRVEDAQQRSAPAPSSSSTSPSAGVPARRPVNPARTDRPRHPVTGVSFGDNDAPILP